VCGHASVVSESRGVIMAEIAAGAVDLAAVAGWRRRWLSVFQALGFFALAVAGSLIVAGCVMAFLHIDPRKATPGLSTMMIFEFSQWGGVLVATIAARWLFKLTLAEAGYAPMRVTQGLALGGVLGFVLLSAIIGVLFAVGMISFGPLSFDGVNGLAFLAEFAVMFIAVALVEEGMIRGPLLALLSRATGFWPAAVLTSLLFLALHLGNKGETVIGIANVGVVGLALAWIRRRTGTLWLAIGFHATWDFAQSYVWGVPDSGLMLKGSLTVAKLGAGPDWLTGGTAGPEGGLLCTVSIALLVLIVDRMWPRDAR